MYFNKFGKIEYKIQNRTYELLDIFTKVSFLGDYTSSKIYDKYTIQEGETPDDVSGVVYGDLSLSWLILLVNNIYSEDEWYSGDNTFLNIVGKKYPGESYYITNIPALKEGDVMVKVLTTSGTNAVTVDETTYRVVGGFDKGFRRVWGRGGSGTFSAGDNIMFGRKNTQTGAVDIIDFVDSSNTQIKTQYATLRFVEKRETSPVELLQYTNDIVVPPNVVFSSGTIQSSYIPSNTIYTNLSDATPNFANTLLYYYMTNSGTVPGIRKETFYSTEYDKYREKQIISVIKPNYLSAVIDMVQNLLKTNEVGKRVTIRL